MNKLTKSIKKISTGVALALASGLALAVPPTTPAELASSVDFAAVGLAMLAVAGVVCALYVTWKGAQFVIRAVRSA